MLLVNARAGVSSIHGIGLFAHEFIPEGTQMWVLEPTFDVMLTEEQISSLPAAVQVQVRHYAYFAPKHNCYVLSSDDSRFCNHADDANTLDDGDIIYAAHDIYPGEELTWDYRPWGLVTFEVNRITR